MIISKNRKYVFFISVCFLSVFFRSYLSFAQSKIPDSLVRERLQCIQLMLNHNKTSANLWWYGWIYAYSAATIGQGMVYFLSTEKSTRQDMVLGATTTLLGVAGQLITPMVPCYAPDRLIILPENSEAERIIKLNYAETLLESSANREIDGRSWQPHLVCGLVNLGSGLITWIGFKRSIWAGIGNFALNTCISEAQIWSQPINSIKDYKKYNAKYKNGCSSSCYNCRLNWHLNVRPDGVVLKLSF